MSGKAAWGWLLVLFLPASPAWDEELARTTFADYYQAPSVAVVASVPPYALPLEPAKLSNWAALSQPGYGRYFDLGRIEWLIANNGFGVMASSAGDDMVEPYKLLKQLNIPILVTTDTLLDLYHVQFDETLRDIEERDFYGAMLALTRALGADAIEQEGKQEGDLGEAARR